MTLGDATAYVSQDGHPGAAEDIAELILLWTDARVAVLLLNEARVRGLMRMFGISRGQANLVTAAALLTLSDSAQRKVARWWQAPGWPTPNDSALTAAGAGAGLQLVGGPVVSKAPHFAGLAALALVGGLGAPTAVRALRAARGAPHRLHETVTRQYERLAASVLQPGPDRAA